MPPELVSQLRTARNSGIAVLIMWETTAWKQAERYRNTPGAALPRSKLTRVFEVGQHFVTKTAVLLEQVGATNSGRFLHPSSRLETEQYARYGIEVKIGSLTKDGSTSCVVISRGVGRYDTKLSMKFFSGNQSMGDA